MHLRSLIDDVVINSATRGEITILSMSVIDLAPNYLEESIRKPLKIALNVGPSSEATGPWIGGDGAVYPQWRGLNFSFSIMKDMRVRMGLFLGSDRIGATFYQFNEIKTACDNSSNTGELYGVLVDLDDSVIGKLRMTCHFVSDKPVAFDTSVEKTCVSQAKSYN